MSDTLKDRLNDLSAGHARAGAERLLDRVAVDLAAGESAVTRPRRAGAARAAGVFAAAAIATTVLVGLVALVAFERDEDSPVATTVTPSTIAETTTTVPAPAPPPEMLTWRIVPWDDAVPASRAEAFMNAIATGGPGFIGGGALVPFDVPGADPAIWVSEDGETWEHVESPAFDTSGRSRPDNDTFIADVAAGPRGVVAVGAEGRAGSPDYDAVAWYSPDGRTWQRVDDIEGSSGDGPHIMRIVEAGGPGWVAVGEHGWVAAGEEASGITASRDGIWTSADGLHWSAVPGDELAGPDETMDITGLAVGDGILVAVGHLPCSKGTYFDYGGGDSCGGFALSYEPLAWRSTDGITWQRFAMPKTVDPALEAGAVVESVTVTSGGTFVAVGKTMTRRPDDYFTIDISFAVWTSRDGRDWQIMPGALLGLEQPLPSSRAHQPDGPQVSAWGDGLLIVAECYFDFGLPGEFGDMQRAGCVLASNDGGATWVQIAPTPDAADILKRFTESGGNADVDGDGLPDNTDGGSTELGDISGGELRDVAIRADGTVLVVGVDGISIGR